MAVILQANRLEFRYRAGKTILKDISFTVSRGEVVSLLGPNGTGKTTLLLCLLGIHKPGYGSIHLSGSDISSLSARDRAQKMAYVPQASALTFPYSVREVVMMGRIAHLGFGGGPTREDHKSADRAISDIDITHLAEKMFQQLSGGEKQLVMIARALTQNAGLLVMDEPTASLDLANQTRALELVRALSQRGYTILMTTHSPDHAFLVSDKVVLIKEGHVMACGTPDDTLTSNSLSALYGIPAVVTETTVISAGRPVKVCIPAINAQE